MPCQPGILADVPRCARYLCFRRRPGADLVSARRALVADAWPDDVIGVGAALLRAWGIEIDGARTFPTLERSRVPIPSTPTDVWAWLRGDDPGDLLHRGRTLAARLEDAFVLDEAVDAFRYHGGLDLTGYEDGTENPEGDHARSVALVAAAPADRDGGSFAAVQRWTHELGRFAAMDPDSRDATIGRRIADNEEMDDAPPSAHVKRAEQEATDPPSFMVRRSMPWTLGAEAGLMFVAFGASLDPFETVLRRMTGHDDGIVDALFDFSRPVTGHYAWCPPVDAGGRLRLG